MIHASVIFGLTTISLRSDCLPSPSGGETSVRARAADNYASGRNGLVLLVKSSRGSLKHADNCPLATSQV